MFFIGVGTALIGAASRNIGLDPESVGWMISAQNIGLAVTVIVFGALADVVDKARLMAWSSVFITAAFALYYRWDSFAINLVLMGLLGMGIGGYEGAADALLLAVHDRRPGLFVTINHFFVTFGELGITLYLLALQMDWRKALTRSALATLILGFLFVLSRVPPSRRSTRENLADRIRFLARERTMAVLLALSSLTLGASLAFLGQLPGFLIDFRGFDLVTSKLG